MMACQSLCIRRSGGGAGGDDDASGGGGGARSRVDGDALFFELAPAHRSLARCDFGLTTYYPPLTDQDCRFHQWPSNWA